MKFTQYFILSTLTFFGSSAETTDAAFGDIMFENEIMFSTSSNSTDTTDKSSDPFSGSGISANDPDEPTTDDSSDPFSGSDISANDPDEPSTGNNDNSTDTSPSNSTETSSAD